MLKKMENAYAVCTALSKFLESFAPKYCATTTDAPAESPVKKPMTKLDRTEADPPTLASASFPTKRPTMMASTVLYSCCTRVPITIGKKKMRSCFQMTPSVIGFVILFFSLYPPPVSIISYISEK